MNHLEDFGKVISINIAAIIVSLADFEATIRIAGLLMALIYTSLKIVQLLRGWNK
jgi:hypothetical protein